MVGKADRGHATGGVTFAYRNVEVRTADGKRSHVEFSDLGNVGSEATDASAEGRLDDPPGRASADRQR